MINHIKYNCWQSNNFTVALSVSLLLLCGSLLQHALILIHKNNMQDEQALKNESSSHIQWQTARQTG